MRDHGRVSPASTGSTSAAELQPGSASQTADPVGPGWAAPVATQPVNATVTVPGSKSLTNRALILAAQATGPSRLIGALRSRDTELMAAALRALGTVITQNVSGDGAYWLVEPAPLSGPAVIDCGLAGTVMRFLPALAATAKGEITFDGDPAARRRPMSTVLEALRALGASIDGDALPCRVNGNASPSIDAPSARRASSTVDIGRRRAAGSPSKVISPFAVAANAGRKRMTVPASPQSITAGPASGAGSTSQSVVSPVMSWVITVPSARSAAAISSVSRLRRAPTSLDGPVAWAARISARLVRDFEPGTVTVALTGRVATGADQPAPAGPAAFRAASTGDPGGPSVLPVLPERAELT